MSNILREDKIKKLENFKQAGVDPYPSLYFEKETSDRILAHEPGQQVRAAGRIMLFRDMGNLTFFHIQDEGGRIQVVLNKKEFSGDYKLWVKNLDLGDFVGVSGERFDTKKGEKSILARELALLAKSIRPLPDKYRSIKDEEERHRKRYLDFLFNEEAREVVYKRDIFWNSVRSFLKEKGFIEVETPVLETVPGGGDARPFITHHNALDLDVYLRISTGELWQKRLLIAGFEKTFEIGRQFRNEGMDSEHLQDYSQMEFYWAYADYKKGMELVMELYRYIAMKTFGTQQFKIRDFEIDLSKEWETYDYQKTVLEKTGVNITTATLEEIEAKLKELSIKYDKKGFNITRGIDNLWKYCRKSIAGPGFLVNEPVTVSPLAKRKKDDPLLTERFHVLIAGSELGNGYSELNDPMDQASRFAEQQKLREKGDEEAQMNDEDFVEALEYGMPPACGFGMSTRVFSFFMNKSARESEIFPLVKPKVR